MRRLIGIFAALTLAACATTTAHEDAGKALITAETLVDAAAIAADGAVKGGLTTKAQDGAIAALAPQVEAEVAKARAAYAAGDPAAMATETSALTALAARLDAAHTQPAA